MIICLFQFFFAEKLVKDLGGQLLEVRDWDKKYRTSYLAHPNIFESVGHTWTRCLCHLAESGKLMANMAICEEKRWEINLISYPLYNLFVLPYLLY